MLCVNVEFLHCCFDCTSNSLDKNRMNKQGVSNQFSSESIFAYYKYCEQFENADRKWNQKQIIRWTLDGWEPIRILFVFVRNRMKNIYTFFCFLKYLTFHFRSEKITIVMNIYCIQIRENANNVLTKYISRFDFNIIPGLVRLSFRYFFLFYFCFILISSYAPVFRSKSV